MTIKSCSYNGICVYLSLSHTCGCVFFYLFLSSLVKQTGVRNFNRLQNFGVSLIRFQILIYLFLFLTQNIKCNNYLNKYVFNIWYLIYYIVWLLCFTYVSASISISKPPARHLYLHLWCYTWSSVAVITYHQVTQSFVCLVFFHKKKHFNIFTVNIQKVILTLQVTLIKKRPLKNTYMIWWSQIINIKI